MTNRAIAERLGISVATVERDLRSASAKLRRIPGGFEALLHLVRLERELERCGPCCGSVECDREWIERNGR